MRHGHKLTRGALVWLLGAALAAPLALADPPAADAPPAIATATSPSATDAPAGETAATSAQTPIPQALGIAEGALSYCGPVDPEAAEGLRQLIGQMTQGASERQLAEVRDSDEYRKAYDSVVGFTSKIEGPRNGKRFCSGEARGRT
ncbi:MAG TPA: hypothetical protein VEU54_07255 [Steroidobacteraceae bacterium]|nr:hypothetical protein [Steroidobacteraceae bacterium]